MMGRALVTDFGHQRALLDGARAGDTDAIAELYEQYGTIVFRVAARLLNSTDDAEDVVQDVFLGLGRALRTFEGRGSFEGWLKRVTSRTALMMLRRERIRSEIPIDKHLPVRAAPGGTSPADRLTLEAALASLPDTLRAVFVLKEIEGYTHEEIGITLGIRPGASKIRLYRARKQLQQFLEGSR